MIRWTVVRDCGLRDLGRRPLAEHAARQLQGLAEWSRARREGLCHQGWCLQPQPVPSQAVEGRQAFATDQATPEGTGSDDRRWLGFREDEVFAVFGGIPAVQAACHACPANMRAADGDVAGCWGTLAFWPGGGSSPARTFGNQALPPDELRLGTGQTVEISDLAVWFEAELDSNPGWAAGFRGTFPATKPRWYGLWTGAEWKREQLEWLAGFGGAEGGLRGSAGWKRMVSAAAAALRKGLAFCYDRVPPGVSDGTCWRLASHCRVCAWPRAEGGTCPCCGDAQAVVPARSRRVLGLRPWLDLSRLVDADQLRALTRPDGLLARPNHTTQE